jgi:hypothetical protein
MICSYLITKEILIWRVELKKFLAVLPSEKVLCDFLRIILYIYILIVAWFVQLAAYEYSSSADKYARCYWRYVSSDLSYLLFRGSSFLAEDQLVCI